MSQNPIVSVVMITYGHENYIREAIEGVLMQNCDFEVELIVANDCSPDKTDLIIKDIIQNHPRGNWIKYHHHEKNLGMMPNFIFALEKAKGKYVALCDGDDYWIDSLKLKKQVDFLESNPDYVIHSGKAKILRDEKLKNIVGDPLSKKIYKLSDFYTKNNLITCTVIYRNTPVLCESLQNLTFLDWMLYVLLLSKKTNNIAYVCEDVYSVYRVHNKGVIKEIETSNLKAQLNIAQISAIRRMTNLSYSEDDIFRINNFYQSNFRFNLLKKKYLICLLTLVENIIISKCRINFKKYLKYVLNGI